MGCKVTNSDRPGHYRVVWTVEDEDNFEVAAVDLELPIDLRGFEKRALLEAGEWLVNEKAIEWLLQNNKLPKL